MKRHITLCVWAIALLAISVGHIASAADQPRLGNAPGSRIFPSRSPPTRSGPLTGASFI
jgi:hypothetical protein